MSKSEYMMFLKHPAWLWYKKHDKAKLPEVDANTQAMFDAGADFEAYAQQRFPEGEMLGFDNYQQYKSLPDRTRATLERGTETVFQARFEGEDLTCICDVVTRVDERTLDVYEVKSSTQVKDEHISDLGFQLLVLEKAGWSVRNLSVIHVNKYYIRKGDIDPYGLTRVEEVTPRVAAVRDSTQESIDQARSVVSRSEPPDISPRHASPLGFRDWLDIFKQLKGDLPETSIYNLFSPGSERIARLEDLGITDMADIPEDFDLTPKQRWQVTALKRGEPYRDDRKIAEFLSGLEYPLYFLDYETLSDLVPPFEGMRPYEQLPFQYSLHVLHAPEGEPEHYEYLHTDATNPAPSVVERLRQDIGETGSVLVWSEQFEKSCNQLMGRLYPEGASFLENINDRVRDLMIPFAHGWFVDARFRGSASIKHVLSVLVPDLSYEELDIQEGGSAQRLWMDAVLRGKEVDDIQKLFRQLSGYCLVDTLAMVRIYQRLREEVDSNHTRQPPQQLSFL